MAALALPTYRPRTSLTENEFEFRSEPTAASLGALTKPKEQTFEFPSKGNAFRIVVTTNQHPTPEWVEPTISALIGVQSLPDNWNSYGGRKINRDLIRQSLSILEQIMDATSPAPSIVPLDDGGLQFEWHRRQQDLEIAFPADDASQYYYRNKVTGVEQDGFARDVVKLVWLLRGIS